ncbi:LOW QUALITY PROTEIN: 1-aminocyclopropane-1-carboxylate oxidase homolog 4-like [Argentina anserina]|uniref:LOW QUALITY PROTEIN: 1-aminocyclopropane-1-carboxylate oxidase homolog 4-like n=1 Tax=Argentina anserina TaxID=57926 RepID=UPI0021763B0B|nr:LOW QUALITY PROTEIN: 1-aminocyclopropane-1-carboxylate oxidase homolog 4-like [Potentilla anserina]
MKMATNSTLIGEQGYDRAHQVKQFDDSKLGVKGLVDSGLSSIPRIFIHPPETLHQLQPTTRPIPTIDLSDRRSALVDRISAACRKFGFFRITNHGIPPAVLDRTIAAVKAFHEQPAEVRAQFYGREMTNGVSYFSNLDLYTSRAASWSDTLQMRLAPIFPDDVPEICREEIAAWNKEIQRLGEELLGLVSQGLGLPSEKLKGLTCLEGRAMVGNYYPPCPQPDLTTGLTSHSDPGVLTVLLEDHVGGLDLEVKHGGAWVDVEPVPGALVINVGDLLQIMSNEEYKSVDHRVLANPHHEPRVSIAVFLNPSNREGVFGPLPELVSPEKPALYKEFKFSEFMMRFFTKGLDGKSLVNYYKLQ